MDANIVESAERQQQFYEGCESRARLEVGQQVLLENPSKGKLDPRWTGPWIVIALRGPSTVLLKMGITERAVHINHVCPLLTDEFKNQTEPVAADWTPPLFNHEAEPEATTSESSSVLQEGSTEGQASSPVVPVAAPSQVNPLKEQSWLLAEDE